jgi:hypothetical protein
MKDILFLSHRVDSLKSAKEFCDLNKIIPREIIILWDEEIEE